MSGGGQSGRSGSGTSIWEWVVAAVGGTLIILVIGYMAWYGLSKPLTAPVLTIEQTSVGPSGDGHLLQIIVRNEGGSTAAAVLISGELLENGSTIEESEATINYVPENSEREAALQFTRDPTVFSVQLRIKGMTKP